VPVTDPLLPWNSVIWAPNVRIGIYNRDVPSQFHRYSGLIELHIISDFNI
jgi:hypothetical protein